MYAPQSKSGWLSITIWEVTLEEFRERQLTLQEMESCCLAVRADDFSFEASATKPVILIGSRAPDVARSIVCLNHLPGSSDSPGAELRSLSLKYPKGRALSPSPTSIPAWRRDVCFISLDNPGLLDPRYSFPTPFALLNEICSYESRLPGKSHRSNFASLNRLQKYLQKLNLHSSCAFAPYEEMTANEKALSSIAIVLALKPKSIVLSGNIVGFECAVNAILAEGIPMVWADCDHANKSILLSRAELVNVDGPVRKEVPSLTSMPCRGASDMPRQWTDHRAVSSTRFERMSLTGGAWAILLSPVLADAGKRVVFIEREVSRHSPMNDVHLWQVVAASLAIVAVLYGQKRLNIGLEHDLSVAALRCVVQLNILGYLLVPVFDIDSWWIVVLFLSVMLAVAAQEASSRPPFYFSGMYIAVLKSLVCVFVAVMSFAVFAFQSGFTAIVLIPIGGMLVNNALSATAIALSSSLTYLSERKGDIEALLCLGATRFEATKDLLRRSVTVGLTPVVSLMNTAGIVSISGLMAGQLLAHALPINAARNQIVLLFLITASTSAACTAATISSILAILDEHHRVRAERLMKRPVRENGISELLSMAWSHLIDTIKFSVFYVTSFIARFSGPSSFGDDHRVEYRPLD